MPGALQLGHERLEHGTRDRAQALAAHATIRFVLRLARRRWMLRRALGVRLEQRPQLVEGGGHQILRPTSFQNCVSPITVTRWPLAARRLISMSFSPPSLPATWSAFGRPRTRMSVEGPGLAWKIAPDFFAAALAPQEPRERDPPARNAFDPSFAQLLRRVLQGVDQLRGGLVALAARAETPMDHFLEMIAAGEPPHVAAVHRRVHVAAQQHGDQLADLIDVVALLPFPDFAPRDLRRRAERVERVRGDAAAAGLVGRDAEVAELQAFVLAHEDVEGREVAVQRLAAMQHVERLQDRGDLLAHEALGLRAFLCEPAAEIAVLGVLHDEAVARARRLDVDEAVEDLQRARLAAEQLGKVRLPQPAGHAVRDLDADAGWQRAGGFGRREVDLAEAALADEAIEEIRAPRFAAIQRRGPLR